MARRHDDIADLGVHPGELCARLAGGEQPVARIDADAMARSFQMEAEDFLQRRQDLADERIVTAGGDVRERSLEEPEGRVDRVVLGSLAAVGESIRQEPAVAMREKSADDVSRLVEAAA